MIITSRWMASGPGRTEFRQTMLEDRRLRELVGCPAANNVFPGVEGEGRVSYFLWVERQVPRPGSLPRTTGCRHVRRTGLGRVPSRAQRQS